MGLPESATVGESYSFQIVGDLTHGRPDASRRPSRSPSRPTADGQLQGTATTTINYADWGISVPNVPFVTDLAETVTLELDFMATAAE